MWEVATHKFWVMFQPTSFYRRRVCGSRHARLCIRDHVGVLTQAPVLPRRLHHHGWYPQILLSYVPTTHSPAYRCALAGVSCSPRARPRPCDAPWGGHPRHARVGPGAHHARAWWRGARQAHALLRHAPLRLIPGSRRSGNRWWPCRWLALVSKGSCLQVHHRRCGGS